MCAAARVSMYVVLPAKTIRARLALRLRLRASFPSVFIIVVPTSENVPGTLHDHRGCEQTAPVMYYDVNAIF